MSDSEMEDLKRQIASLTEMVVKLSSQQEMVKPVAEQQPSDPNETLVLETRLPPSNAILNDPSSLLNSEMPVGGGRQARRNVACIRAPLKTRDKVKNNYRDDGVEAKQPDDEKYYNKNTLLAREYKGSRCKPEKVVVSCRVCQNRFLVDPAFAPVSYGSDDGSSYVCNSCSVGGARR